MGRRGPTRKDPELSQGHREHQSIELAANKQELEIPRVPGGLLKVTRARWDAFWTSDICQVVDGADHFAVERLFLFYDQWQRYYSAVKRLPLTEGSLGQLRAHPLSQRLTATEKSIRSLEDALGITPLARMRLGIAIGEAKLTAAEVNRLTQENSDASAIPDELAQEWEQA